MSTPATLPAASKLSSPHRHLQDALQEYGDLIHLATYLHQDPPNDQPAWKGHIFVPTDVLAVEAAKRSGADPRDPDQLMAYASTMVHAHDASALAAWRMTKGIYHFDPTLFDALFPTPLKGPIPSQALRHLPEWCLYMALPQGPAVPESINGVFVYLDRETSTMEERVYLTFDFGTHLMPIFLPLDRTLDEGIRRLKNAPTGLGPYPSDDPTLDPALLSGVLNLALYLCLEHPDLPPGTRPGKPKPKKTKRGWKTFPASQPRTWNVGERTGAALRRGMLNAPPSNHSGERYGDGPPRARPRGHLRRAHWHPYRTGPRDQEPHTYRWRWIPPLPINVDLEDHPAVHHAVH